MSIPETDLEARAFPKLTVEQIDLLRPYGDVRQAQAGEVLFEVGDRASPMVVVLAGSTEIVDRSERVDRIVNVGGPGDFHGELACSPGRPPSPPASCGNQASSSSCRNRGCARRSP